MDPELEHVLDKLFGRMDEIFVRLDTIDARMENGFAEVDARMENGFAEVNERLGNIEDLLRVALHYQGWDNETEADKATSIRQARAAVNITPQRAAG